VGEEHDVDRFGEAHHRCRLVGELQILRRADRFVEGRRAVEIGHWQVDENHLGHRSISRCGESLFDLFGLMSYENQPWS
jgi:hypothetical protein